MIPFKQFITEGLDLYVTGHQYKGHTKDLLGVTHALTRALNPEFGVMMDDINPDTSHSGAFDRKGTINIYKPKGSDDEDHKNTALAALEWLKSKGFRMSGIRKEKSGMYEGNVWRIDIAQMPENTDPPDVHMTYSNAIAIFKALGMDHSDIDRGAFTIDAHELLERIQQMKGNIHRMKQHERPNKQVGPNMYSQGIDYTYFQRRYGDLEQLAQWAIDNGYDTITGS